MEIRLWSVVAEAGALAVAGPGARVHESGDTRFAAGPDATVVIVSGVRNAEDVTVAGPFPRLVEGRLTGGDGPGLQVFTRLPEGLLVLGTARITERGRRRGVLHRVDLRLDTPLPEHLLTLAGTTAEQPGTDWLDLLPDDPVKALEQFTAGWYADVPAGDPVPGTGQPEPLRAFHRAAAGRAELYGGALRVHREPRPGGPDQRMIFGEGGDGTFQLLIDAGVDDPHVYYHGLSDQPLRERERLAAYLMLSVLARAAIDGSPGGMAFADRAQARRIVAPLRRVPLRPLRWPCAHSRLYAGPDLIALVGADDADWFEVYVGARSRPALRRLRKLGLDWASFDG
ncbi:hypothetical protein [Actinoplanes utahensis]|uniref:Uncharacterized protein n=1 Tax=Actinoplanes utahensis TaxID=1869 RepID=A0A0A6UIX8_ACTUT|nr:hypothetical protein [Actinoplanes utahensis]KHD75033.1 hypothetical protein MB27_24970 [Actinoplanes utahensis]GIF28432.1 hypothetical protein Aut01nite_14180 [Actinoplanes utahensis]